MTSNTKRWITMVVILTGTLASRLTAISPDFWVHSTEADFSAGQTQNTVITNLGDIKLATDTESMEQISDQATVIHDIQIAADGSTYLAIGPEAAILQKRGDKIDRILSLPMEQVFAMDLLSDGRLLIAVSATNSRLGVLKDNKLETLVELKGVRYVWDMIVDNDQLILATGTEGKLLRVDLSKLDKDQQPVVTELLDTAQNNLLCLGQDAKGNIYVGSDNEGLVYRVVLNDIGVPEVFVLYDAPEPEIGAILVLNDGTVYAGTADAKQARPGRLEEAATAESGRPESTKPTDAKPDPGDMPQIPPKPEPMDQPKQSQNTQPKQDIKAQTTTPFQPNQSQGENQKNSHPQNQLRGLPRFPAEFRKLNPQTSKTKVIDDLPEPTTNQRDILRNEIRIRLEKARQTGTLRSSKSKFRDARQLSGKKKANTPSSSGSKDGNAIYQINPDGFVAEIFRESVMILKLLEEPSGNGTLMVATGNEGQIFRIDPFAQETTILVDLEPQQVPAMVKDEQGRVLLGTANPAALMLLKPGFAQHGTYTSPILDANQISLWGKALVSSTTWPGTSLSFETRSGNVQDPDQANWSAWSKPKLLAYDPKAEPLAPREISVGCPPARFLQYRLTFSGKKQATAIVDRVQIAYVVPNLKPVISSILTKYPNSFNTNGTGGGYKKHQAKDQEQEQEETSILEVEWEASDPNSDRLIYHLEYQPAGSDTWLTIAKDLEESSFQWHTRKVPDGRYLIRVTASDKADNPGSMAKIALRRADPILIDNAPPSIGPLNHQVVNRTLRIVGSVSDALSPIGSVSYSLDSAETWQPILPDDLIYDSTRETFTVNIPQLSQGSHVVAIRAYDNHGNSRHDALLLEID